MFWPPWRPIVLIINNEKRREYMKTSNNIILKPLHYIFLTLAIAFGLITISACGGGGSDTSDDNGGNSAPTITSFSPTSGQVGTSVTITGTNFSTTAAGNTVKFNGTTSIVTSSTATQIVTSVPTDATTGKITVAVSGSTATSSDSFTVNVTPASLSLSGTAAAGAPIIGTVTVKDSLGAERVTLIEADGSYSIDVTGMTAPFALRADGYVGNNEYHLYSASATAEANGTVNITPFTDLIIADLAGDIAANYYDSEAFATLTSDDLAAAETALQTKLQPILTALGVSDSIDLLRTSFDTDHTGLDAVIDVVKVTVDPDTVKATLTNVINNESIEMDIAGGSSTGTFTDTGVSEGVTDYQTAMDVLNTFTNLFATSLPSPSNPTLLALFDADTFLNDGEDINAWLTEITSSNSIIGIHFENFVLISVDDAAGTAEVSFDVVMADGTKDDGTNVAKMVRKNGVWCYAGNQRIAHVQMRSEAQYMPYNSEIGTQFRTGLHFDIEANYPAGANVHSAVVTGPGLPQAGIVLNKQINYEWFAISGLNGDNLYSMTDPALIDSIPENASYMIVLKDGADGTGNDLGTYTETVRKGPMKLSELSAASFPVITAPTVANLEAFNGGNLTITWVLPIGLESRWVELTLADQGFTNTVREEKDVTAATTSKTLTINASSLSSVANRSIYIQTRDSYQRNFQIGIW
jgi:uncharacterized protein (TIGR03437 family)